MTNKMEQKIKPETEVNTEQFIHLVIGEVLCHETDVARQLEQGKSFAEHNKTVFDVAMAVAKFYQEQLDLRMDAYARERKALAEIEKLKQYIKKVCAKKNDRGNFRESKMKKIMFSDKYGLTAAVLAETKTQTRRIINAMPKDPKIAYGLENEVGYVHLLDGYTVIAKSKYKIGEIVAIAQSYYDIKTSANSYRPKIWKGYDAWHNYLDTLPIGNAGYYNKMFVSAELMPNKIKITDIRIQRLQDISNNDCIAEGIIEYANGVYTYADRKKIFRQRFGTPRVTYADLIDRISGKGTWNSNPYVFVYNFKLVKK